MFKWIVANATPILLTLFSVIAAYLLGRREKKQKVSFLSDQNSILIDASKQFPDVKLKWGSRDVENLRTFTYLIWNSGDKVLSSSDFPSKDPIRLRIPKTGPPYATMTIKVFRLSDEPCELTVTHKWGASDQNYVQEYVVGFEYLAMGDGVVISLISTQDESTNPMVKGRLKNGHKLEEYVLFEKNQNLVLKAQESGFSTAMFGIVFGGVYLTYVNLIQLDLAKPYVIGACVLVAVVWLLLTGKLMKWLQNRWFRRNENFKAPLYEIFKNPARPHKGIEPFYIAFPENDSENKASSK